MTSSKSTRRTQAERTTATRAKLIEAALDCIAEYGYLGATTTLIVKKAGVSRGAQVHHFPTKLDLVTAAAEHLYMNDIEESRSLLNEIKNFENPFDALIDRIWINNFHGRLWAVTLELVTASRGDRELRSRLMPIVEKYHRRIDEIASIAIRTKEISTPGINTMLNLSICVLRGMGFQTVLKDDPDYYNNMLALLKEIAGRYMEMRPST